MVGKHKSNNIGPDGGNPSRAHLRPRGRAVAAARGIMSARPMFVIAYMSGAAAMAAWIDIRLAGRRPSSWRAVGLLVAASMLIDANIGLVLHLTAPIVSVMVFGLAALVFSLLVCLWTLRMLRSAMPA